ncbi:MAG: glycosyltransferase family 9 protein [Planctomycetia bacterium]
MHIVVILPRWVGDLVMSTPMLRAVRDHFGRSARITGVAKPMFAELLEGTPWLDRMVFYDRHSRDRSRRFRSVARQLRADRADVALIVPNSLSSAALAWSGGARRRVGFARHGRRLLLTDPLEAPRAASKKGGLASWFRVEPASPAGHAMDLAERIGVPRQPLTLELATKAADEANADDVLARLFPSSSCGASAPLVVFNDNGAYGPSKAWGADRFAALARRAIERLPGARVLVHCGPGDRDEARAIVRAAAHPAVQSLADEPQLPFGLSKAVLRRAAVLVTSDSGPRHIAAAFGTPTVVLHGPMDPRLSRSDQRHLVEMRLDLPCSPCGRRVCPLGHHDCMRLLTVDDVEGRMIELVTRAGVATA